MKKLLSVLPLLVFLVIGKAFAGDTVTIYDIQYTTDPSGNSPYLGQTVTTFGIVTGTYTNTTVKGFSLEEQPGGAWHGIFVFTGGTPEVAKGDSIVITAVVDEFHNRTELHNIVNITVLKHNATLPGPTIVRTGDAPQEKYEGVFLRVENAVCESLPNTYGEWWVNDGSGPLMIDDMGVSYNPELGTRYNIQGFLDYSYGNYKLEPRYFSDIEEVTGNLPPEIKNVTHNPPLPDRGDYLTVSALITDDHTVIAESLYYSVDSMETWLSIGPSSVVGDTYSFTVGPQPVGTKLYYFVSAIDDSGAVAYSDTSMVLYLDFNEIIPIGYLHILDDQGMSIFTGVGGIKVKGVVTVAGELGLTYYVQDSTGGVALYDISGFMQRGDTVVVTGLVDNFYGLVEIKSGSVLERTAGEEPKPLVKTLYDLTTGGEIYEGVLVRVNHVTTNATVLSGAINIYDSTGSFTIYIDNDSELYGLPAPEGEFNVVGVISQHVSSPPYFGGYQIVPRNSEDIIARGDGSGSLAINPPYLLQGEKGDVTFHITAGLDSIRAIQIVLPEVLNWSYRVEDVDLMGNLVGATVNLDSLSGSITISSFSSWEDSFKIRNVKAPDSVFGAFDVILKTSVSGEIQDLRKIIGKPQIFITLPIEKVQEPGPDGYASHMVGDSVTIAGVVTGPSSTFSPTGMTSLWIQDRTGGVNVFFSGATLPYKLGDLISLVGTVTEYNGVTEVSVGSEADFHLLGRDYPQPEPYQLKVSENLREDLEGLLLKFEGQVASPPAQQGSGKAFQVWNGQVPINVYVYDNSGIDLSILQVGQTVQLVGICGQYDPDPPYTSGYQFLPRIRDDIKVIGGPQVGGEPTLILNVLTANGKESKKVFAPSLGEVMEIAASGPAGSRYTLKIYDSKGRCVKTFYEETGTPYVVQWKGDDDTGRRLPLGMYIVQLKTKITSGENAGQEKVKNVLVVIAAPLK